MQTAAAMRARSVPGAALALSIALVAGCASGPSNPLPQARSLGVLEGAYDEREWAWMTNADGRALLRHARIPNCFVDPRPDEDYESQDFTVKREPRTIGGAVYEVVTLFEKQDFWEALYLRRDAKTPLIGVYSAGDCQRAAEGILERYERTGAR